MKRKILRKKSRGQVAIEFIFIVLLIVIYLFTTTMPLIQDAQSITGDVRRISLANNETQKIINSITRISLLGIESKETLQIFLPMDSNYVPRIICSNTGELSFFVPLEVPFENKCPGSVCTKTFTPPDGISINCREGFELVGQQKVAITKTNYNTVELLPGE